MEAQPPPPPYLSFLQNCIISPSQEELLDQKGFAFSDNIHQDGQIDEEFEQPSLPLDNTDIRICSLHDSSSRNSEEDIQGESEKTTLESLNREEDRVKFDKENSKGIDEGSGEHCGIEGGVKRIRLIGDCSTGAGDNKEEEEEEDILSIAIKAGLEMPQPRWWRTGGYDTQ
ncbi:hypothetical protein MKW94_004572 [Papaver nudicaule]|uniref:Uncharacterized protein n=1 Tax=Papaver nudicaule TaxID=74823 RepID=A0AA41SA81_PAPNU|nr:hypothetical protein [Papaver nudicaule]